LYLSGFPGDGLESRTKAGQSDRVKRSPKRVKPEWPIEVKVGNVSVKVYRSEARGRDLYTVAYRDTNRTRVKKSFADLEIAKVEAYAAATKIQDGQIDVLQLHSADRIAYQHALSVLRSTGKDLGSVATEYAEAFTVLKGSGSVVEAARFFARHHPVSLPRKTVREVYKEFLEAKKADHASDRYIQDIRSRLGRLAQNFDGQLSDLLTRDLEKWIVGLQSGPVARNSVRALVITLFNFARQRGYIPKNQPTEAEGIAGAKEPPSQIGIFTPEQMTQLLTTADLNIVWYLAIAGFAGLRHAELMRLEWPEVKLAQGHIEVTAGKAKTAQRRIVPIQANLAQWLQSQSATSGRLFKGDGSRFLNKVTKVARDHAIPWPNNALRHSFASYRLAQCKSAAEVALEMGNSPRTVFQHYREIVTPAASEKWWAISPSGKVRESH
jgi:integrase